MPDIERPASFYDEIFERKGWKAPKMIPLCGDIIAELERLGVKSVLDIGCGVGEFLSLCHERGIVCYGFDFSPVAIEICRRNNKFSGHAWVGDALDAANYTGEYGAYVAIEVLEHIIRDMDVIGNLKPNVPFVFSVPDYANVGSGHVRCFKSANEIRRRYGDIINIKSVNKVKKRWLAIASTMRRDI